jgi:nucleotidyltransferase/DNA polymerase involved in DNA repair
VGRLLRFAREYRLVKARPYVLHVDLDQFVVAVELLRRPDLRGRPVVVGGDGDPTKRGVVSSASYEAREFGVNSGTPLRTAVRRCPDAVFLPVDRDAYEAASDEVMTALAGLEGTLELAGWDEAFVAVTTDDPDAFAHLIQHTVRSKARLSCSVGIGDNKLQAKLASDFAKPGGVSTLTAASWNEVMDARPPSALWGIGRKRARALAELGINTVRDLAAADDELLSDVFGASTGPWLKRAARGEGGGPVRSEPRQARSISRERTFQRDLVDPHEIDRALDEIAVDLSGDLKRAGRRTSHVVLKVRYAPFETRTRSARLEEATTDPEIIRSSARSALSDLGVGRPVRLLGLRAELGR